MIPHVPAPVLVFLFSHNLPFSATASVCVPYMRSLDLDATLVWSTGEVPNPVPTGMVERV